MELAEPAERIKALNSENTVQVPVERVQKRQAAAGRQAEDVEVAQGREPGGGHGPGGGEDDLPVAAAGGGDDLGADRHGPAVALLGLAVPGAAVVGQEVHAAVLVRGRRGPRLSTTSGAGAGSRRITLPMVARRATTHGGGRRPSTRR